MKVVSLDSQYDSKLNALFGFVVVLILHVFDTSTPSIQVAMECCTYMALSSFPFPPPLPVSSSNE